MTPTSNDTVNTANSAAPTNTNTTPASNPVEYGNNNRSNRNKGNNNGNVHNNNDNRNNRNANRNSYRGRGNGRGGPRGGLRIGSNYPHQPQSPKLMGSARIPIWSIIGHSSQEGFYGGFFFHSQYQISAFRWQPELRPPSSRLPQGASADKATLRMQAHS